MPNSLGRTSSPRSRTSCKQTHLTHFTRSTKISKKVPPKAGCGFYRSVCVCVSASGVRIFPAVPIQTARVTFTTSPPTPVSPRSPRWYRKRSSHIVPGRRQIAYINRQRPFIFPCQRFRGIILAPCRDFSSPNKRVKINRRVVEALYWDGIIPFTSLNAAGGPIKSRGRQRCYTWRFSPFLKRETTESPRLLDGRGSLNG